MSNQPFKAKIPHTIKIGDKIILEGKVADNAKDFVINLQDDDTIVICHFKTNFEKRTVVFNQKELPEYKDETKKKEEMTWIDGPGKTFVLTFRFGNQEILVHTGNEKPSLQYTFKCDIAISEIKELAVLDGLDYIRKITFRRKINPNFTSNF